MRVLASQGHYPSSCDLDFCGLFGSQDRSTSAHLGQDIQLPMSSSIFRQFLRFLSISGGMWDFEFFFRLLEQPKITKHLSFKVAIKWSPLLAQSAVSLPILELCYLQGKREDTFVHSYRPSVMSWNELAAVFSMYIGMIDLHILVAFIVVSLEHDKWYSLSEVRFPATHFCRINPIVETWFCLRLAWRHPTSDKCAWNSL